MLEIDFYGQHVGPDQCAEVMSTFQSKIALENDKDIILDLSNTQLTDQCIPLLESIFLAPRLIEVRLDNNQLTAQGLATLLSIFSNRINPVQALSLSQNPLLDAGAELLSQHLPHFALVHLHLRDCGFSAQGIGCLATSLFEHQYLETLVLDGNPIKEGMEFIAHLLYKNQKVKTLSLCQCQIPLTDAQEGNIFGSILKHNHSLVSLNLHSNHIHPDFLASFIEQVAGNHTLTQYAGPDNEHRSLESICQRNSLIPCNAPWSLGHNPNASSLEKSIGLIADTRPCADATLLFIAGRKALMQGTLVADATTSPNGLEHQLLDHTYEAATKEILRKHKMQ